MAITAESLSELIQETRKAFADVEDELVQLRKREAELQKQREDLAGEEEAFVSSLRRRFPDYDVSGSPLASPINREELGKSEDVDWREMPRSEAVLRAVTELNDTSGSASPGEIEELLRSRQRGDSRDNIGAALAYLNRSKKIWRRGRGDWVVGARP